MKKKYDVFIAYHGSYEDGGSRSFSDKIHSFLCEKGLKCFYFPASGKDVYKSNILDVMQSKIFILVCTNKLHIDKNGRINPQYHYELSTEIDAFYALTQIGEMSTKKAKVLVCGDCERGKESKLHELFANRTHLYADYDENVNEQLYNWILHELEGTSSWTETQITTEIKDVFSVRASMKEACNFDALVATAKVVKAIGISNTELTLRINPQAITNCINNGGQIEIIFLDPDGKYCSLREEEEGLRPGKIKNITNVNIDNALDMKYALKDKGCNYHLYKYDLQPRMNIIFVDDYLFLQYYANNVPGLNNPSFFIEKQKNSPIYDFCSQVYDYLKSKSEEFTEI